ncbi:unnamed protein product, partial [Acanthoscelides obtectus]
FSTNTVHCRASLFLESESTVINREPHLVFAEDSETAILSKNPLNVCWQLAFLRFTDGGDSEDGDIDDVSFLLVEGRLEVWCPAGNLRGGGVHLQTSVVIRIRVGSMSLFVIESGCTHSSYSKMDDKYREQWMRWYEECESEDESRHDPYSTDDSIADPEYMQQDSDSCTDSEYENTPNNDEPGTSRKKRKRQEPKSKVDLPSGHVDSEGSDDIDVLLDPDNGEQKWEDNIIDCLEFSFDSISVGLKEQLAGTSPIEVFEKIWTVDVTNYIVQKSNKYGELLFVGNRPKSRNERFKTFQHISVKEMKGFLGLCLLAGQLKFKSIRDMFSMDPLNYHPIFPATMSGRRFEQILRCLNCADDENKEDNLYKLSEILLQRKTHSTGTLRSNRKGNPKEVTGAKLKSGQHIWRRKGNVYVSKWRDKHDVLSITTGYKPELVETANSHKDNKTFKEFRNDLIKSLLGISPDQRDGREFVNLMKKTKFMPSKKSRENLGHVLEAIPVPENNKGLLNMNK